MFNYLGFNSYNSLFSQLEAVKPRQEILQRDFTRGPMKKNSLDLKILTTTTKNLPIFMYEFGDSGPEVLILGGVHGDEPEGVIAARGLLQSFLQSFDFKLRVILIPEFNIEGVLNKQRSNSNGVDLNRNLATKDWTPEVKTPRYNPGPSPLSENENQALTKLIENRNFKLIISLHSWNPMINVNGPSCEPEASILHQHTGYKIDGDIGYPTPGSLGTYAGTEREISTITFEIQREIDFAEISKIHVPALLKCLQATENRK